MLHTNCTKSFVEIKDFFSRTRRRTARCCINRKKERSDYNVEIKDNTSIRIFHVWLMKEPKWLGKLYNS